MAKKPANPKASIERTAKASSAPSLQAMDDYGIEALCDEIMAGKSLTAIAKQAGASLTRLLVWIGADPVRSARVREARSAMAKVWDEKAEHGIANAADEFELRKAKELAHHYRWRAAKVSPPEYGDRLAQEVSGPNGGPIQTEGVTSPEERQKRIAELAMKLGMKLTPT